VFLEDSENISSCLYSGTGGFGKCSGSKDAGVVPCIVWTGCCSDAKASGVITIGTGYVDFLPVSKAKKVIGRL
jgi:hypothetical protein